MAEPLAFDPRVTPARPDLAAEALRGRVEAARYVTPLCRRVATGTVAMRARPDATAPYDTELLFGEEVALLDTDAGWAWAQSAADGYVGYLPAGALAEAPQPTHRVTALIARLYARPALKSPPVASLHLGALVGVLDREEDYAQLACGNWIPVDHLCPVDHAAPDWVAVAEGFVGVPYLWGGRSPAGLDCSALVQLARQAAGHRCPRDSDMQSGLGETVAAGAPLCRGDLVFWKGHVGIMLDAGRLLHATAHRMVTQIEPLAEARARIAAHEFGEVVRIARLDPDGD
ncbi:MAG: C40 family peptidase [Pseudomonadota bacterium]